MPRFHKQLIYFIILSLPLYAQKLSSFDEARPVLEQNCVICHGADKQKGDFRLDTRDGVLAGGENEDALDSSNLAESYLLKVVNLPEGHDDVMPPTKHSGPLSTDEKNALQRWVLDNAPYPHGVTLLAKKKLQSKEVLLDGLVSISVYPSEVRLDSKGDQHAIVVYGQYADASTRELTPLVSYESENTELFFREENVFKPRLNGETTVKVIMGEHLTELKVKVNGVENRERVTFQRDVMPTLTALGCNTGSCHGSARGQDGFQLSLYGFDPKGDHHRLTKELIGRRVNLAIPEDSLLLTKSIGKVPHTGGKLTDNKSESYETLLKWIEQGAKYDGDDLKLPIAVEVEPKQLVISGTGQTAQLTVRAIYPDGSDRDVTHLSSFSTSNDSSVKVDKSTGEMTSSQRGESFIMARFHTFTEGVQVIVIPDDLQYEKPGLAENNYIDHHVHNKLHKLRLIPSELCSDEVFMRRVFIDLVGGLPTSKEREVFLNDSKPGKRKRLIDRLLGRPEFTELWVMKWAELLQIRTFPNEVSYKAAILYHKWLQKQFSEQKPFNEIVKAILTSKGGNFGEPATNFYQIEKDTMKLTENVAQVFMGTRIQCAQCHNHPFDRWTMDDYYSFTAFFSQVKRKQGNDPREFIIFDGKGEMKHPVTKQNAKPKFLGGEEPDPKRGGTRREQIADWLTNVDNPWFAKNVANVVWEHFLGVGIIHPVDDVRISNPPSNTELLDALAGKFKHHNFSIKELARDICNSRTYQRATKVNESNKLDFRNFSHAMIRRMRAEVLLDSIAQATATPNKFKGLPVGAKATQIADGNTSTYFLSTFGRATRQSVCSCEVKLEPNLSQALHLLNGESVHNRIQKGKRINEMVKAKKSDAEIIETIYLTTLCRKPTKAELDKLLSYCNDPKQRQQIHEDIFWAVLNSKEFIFNH